VRRRCLRRLNGRRWSHAPAPAGMLMKLGSSPHVSTLALVVVETAVVVVVVVVVVIVRPHEICTVAVLPVPIIYRLKANDLPPRQNCRRSSNRSSSSGSGSSIATPPPLHDYNAVASCCTPCCCRCSARWGCRPAVPV
jgi:hypothetical protein